jgi:hypothetical protein
MAASGNVLLGQPGSRRIGDVVLDNSANSGSCFIRKSFSISMIPILSFLLMVTS